MVTDWPEPHLIETITDQFGTYEQRWQCPPPPQGKPHRVISERWNDEHNVRTVFDWTNATAPGVF